MNSNPIGDHEGALAGICLAPDNEVALAYIAAAGLTEKDFITTAGRIVLAAVDLNKSGRPVDHYSLPDRLTSETLEAFGGVSGLNRLVDAAPPMAHAAFHITAIRDIAAKRRIIEMASGWAEAARNGSQPAELLENIRNAIATEERLANGTTSGFPAIENAQSFTAADIPEPPQIVEGVIHRGSKLVYGGPSKAMKTWVFLYLCLCVACGMPWLGFGTHLGRVLYINLELQMFSLQHRLKVIAEALGVAIPQMLNIWNLRGHSCPVSKLLPELLRQIRGEGYDLIVIDPIYKTLDGRDENAAGDIGKVCSELEAVAVQTGAAVAFGAHFAKGNASGKESIDRISGSGVWARDPDSIIVATPHESDGAFSIEMTLRNFPQPPPFVVRWQYPLMLRDGELDPSRLRQARQRSGCAPVRPDVTELIQDAVSLVKPKVLNISVFKGKLYRMAGTQSRVRELVNILVGEGHLEELHERGRGRHEAWIGTPDQIKKFRQKELQ